MNLDAVHLHAEALLDLLVDEGPLTSDEICKSMAWPKGRFMTALRYARIELCPVLELAIPHPVPEEGWRYQVTTEWQPVERGAAFALGMIETRLRSTHRDVQTVKPKLPRGSKEWRRANFLDKHLDHILGTLREINDG